MPITRRIYVRLPADPWLSDNLNRLKWGIVEEIEKLDYTPEIFTNPRGKRGLASARSWHPRDAACHEPARYRPRPPPGPSS